MADYKEMYLSLFRAVTAAVELLRENRGDLIAVQRARALLEEAQQKCEDIYVETAE